MSYLSSSLRTSTVSFLNLNRTGRQYIVEDSFGLSQTTCFSDPSNPDNSKGTMQLKNKLPSCLDSLAHFHLMTACK